MSDINRQDGGNTPSFGALSGNRPTQVGRPRLSEAARKGNRVSARFTPGGVDRLHLAAERLGMTAGQFMRESALLRARDILMDGRCSDA